jgi:tetratricopeptide (TPR) repeat protein
LSSQYAQHTGVYMNICFLYIQVGSNKTSETEKQNQYTNIMKRILTVIALIISVTIFGQTAKEYFDRGILKETKKDYKGAIKEFKKATTEDANYATAYFKKGICQMALRDYNSAVEDFDNAIRIDSKYAEAYLKRSVSLISLQKYKEALLDLDKVIEVNSTTPDIFIFRGLLRVETGNKIGACEDFNKAKMNGDIQADKCLQKYCGKSNELEENIILSWIKQENWKIGSDQNNAKLRIIDFIHSNETLENWTELGNMTSIENKKDATLDKVMNLAFEQIKQQAPKAKLTFIDKDENAEYPWIIFTIECPIFINSKIPESQLWYVVTDKQRVYTNFRAVKKAEISTEEKEKWVNFFKTIKLANK